MPPIKGAKLGKPEKVKASDEEIKEYTGMGNLPKSVNSNDVATALKILKRDQIVSSKLKAACELRVVCIGKWQYCKD